MVAKVFKGIGLLFVILIVAAFFLPPLEQSRGEARRAQCKFNLKQIMIALNAYESAYGVFPPAYTADSDGRPLHSWRTLILPYLESLHGPDHKRLYEKIDLSKAWDDPANKVAYETSVFTYGCPSADFPETQAVRSGNMTPYLAAVTNNSCLRPIQSLKKKEITDGLPNTLVIIEVMPEQVVHWMQPADADQEMILKFCSLNERPHSKGTHIGMADGSVRFLSTKVTETTLRSILTANGGDYIHDF